MLLIRYICNIVSPSVRIVLQSFQRVGWVGEPLCHTYDAAGTADEARLAGRPVFLSETGSDGTDGSLAEARHERRLILADTWGDVRRGLSVFS